MSIWIEEPKNIVLSDEDGDGIEICIAKICISNVPCSKCYLCTPELDYYCTPGDIRFAK